MAPRTSTLLVALLAACSTAPVCAQTPWPAPRWLPGAAFGQLGAAENDTSTATAGVLWPWRLQHAVLGGTLGGFWEASVGRWSTRTETGRSRAWVTQAGATPVLRWMPGDGAWFVEFGIGVNVITPIYRSADRSFSTVFNFGDQLAIGTRLDDAGRQELSLRVQHYSNAGIRRPNPGENFVQLRYTWRLPDAAR